MPQGGHHFQFDVPKVGLIFKLMCPRWALFSNFKLAGHIRGTYNKENTGIIAAEMFFFFLYFSGPIASRSTPVAQSAPRNLLTRWDVSSIPANGIFLTKNKKKN